MTLIVKDRVKLITDRHGDNKYNPVWMGSQGIVRGTIIQVGEHSIEVEWDNGMRNSGYAPDDLKVVQKHRVRCVKGVRYIKVCSHCSKEMEEDEKKYNIGSEFVCEACYHKLYQTCSECGQIILQEIGLYNSNEKFYCRDCYAKLYTTCDECGEEIERKEAVEYGGDIYCEKCYHKKFAECEECGKIITRDRRYSFGMQFYCEDCYCEKFVECIRCENTILRNEAYISGDEFHCESCYENLQNKTIYDHDYKPEPIFNKQKWENTAYLGIELEVEARNNKYNLAESFINKFGANNFCYLKEDGSLTDGFEIVTHPHTLQKHKDRKWREILKWLEKQGADSYDNADCGLHIHVNRNLLSKLEWHTLLQRMDMNCGSTLLNGQKKIINFYINI